MDKYSTQELLELLTNLILCLNKLGVGFFILEECYVKEILDGITVGK